MREGGPPGGRMAKARTWIFIILAIIGTIVVCLFVLAGASTYWVMKHVKTQPSSATSAIKTFEQERAQFGTQKALLTSDEIDTPSVLQRKIDSLPASSTIATTMEILVWSPTSERTVRISLPFWLLKLGRKKIDIAGADSFDFERMRIDVNQLERIGPKLIVDVERPGGERVLVWTK
jgi:hypothetical protein